MDRASSRSRQCSVRGLPSRSRSLLPKVPSSNGTKPDNRVCINVGGVRYQTFKSTLKNIPDTRLSWLTETTHQNADYDPVTEEYFFDRHPGVFLMILNYYRTGKLHVPTDVCGPMFEEELTFWGIDETQIEPCCWTQYRTHREAEQTLAELDNGDRLSDNDVDDEDEENVASRFGIEEASSEKVSSKWERWKPRFWAFMEDPNSSKLAKIFAFISFIFVLFSVATLVMETHIIFRMALNDSEPLSWNWTNYEKHTKSRPHPALEYIELVCVCFFTVEIICRFICCPNKLLFFKGPLNLVDIFSILPFYIEKIILLINPHLQFSGTLHFFKTIRLIRVFRVFKLTRHFTGLKILVHSIKASAKELLLLIIFLCLSVLIFASLIYYAEAVEETNDKRNDFKSIPIGFWWAVVTMTTLGYGDMTPRTALGYLVGSLCAVAGVLVLALPVPVIVNNFAVYYNHAQARLKLPKKQRKTLVGAADALKTQLTLPGQSEDDEDFLSDHMDSNPSSRSGSPDALSSPTLSDTSSGDSNKKGSDKSGQDSQDSGINAESNTSNESISRINLMYERRPAAPIRHSSDSRLYHTPWRGGALSPVPSTAESQSQSQSPEPPKQFVEYKNEVSPSRSFKRSSKEKSSPEHSSGQDANQNKVEAELSSPAHRRRNSFKPTSYIVRGKQAMLSRTQSMTNVDIN